MAMQVRFEDPELQAKVEQWVSETGRPAEELVEDAITGYFEELKRMRSTLDSRYDDIKSGKVKPIAGDEARTRLLERLESHGEA